MGTTSAIAAKIRAFRAALVACALLSVGCSAVTDQYVTPQFETVERTQIWRLHINVQKVPDTHKDVGALFAVVAQRWINHHRDIIAKRRSVADQDNAALCEGGMTGVITLHPEFSRAGDDVTAKVIAEWKRCDSGKRIWNAVGEGTWSIHDDELKTTTERYAKELGEKVRPWVPAVFRLLKDVLDTMPRPKLTNDDAIMEKIELEE